MYTCYLYYILPFFFPDDFVQSVTEKSTPGTIFQQSTTLTAKMWPPVCY